MTEGRAELAERLAEYLRKQLEADNARFEKRIDRLEGQVHGLLWKVAAAAGAASVIVWLLAMLPRVLPMVHAP